MADDIDIEEHNVLENPRVKRIFPDLSILKKEINDSSDYGHDKSSQRSNSQVLGSQAITTVSEQNQKPCFSQFSKKISENKIILGTKHRNREQISRSHIKKAKVCLQNISTFLNNNEKFCKTCLILFPSKECLNTHHTIVHSSVSIDQQTVNEIKGNNIKQKIKCQKCNMTFVNYGNLNRHKQNIHSHNEDLKNKVEDNRIAGENVMVKVNESNVRALNENNLEECFHCEMTFPTQQLLIDHLYEVLNSRRTHVAPGRTGNEDSAVNKTNKTMGINHIEVGQKSVENDNEITHYESTSISLGANNMRHTLETLGDLSTVNVGDLKIRIEEMLRIKASVSTELRELEERRGKLQKEAAVASANADSVKAEYTRATAELQRLRVSADQARLAQLEAIRRDSPELAPPVQILPSQPPPILPSVSPSSEVHCRMHSCFDHSRCSLTSSFPVYFYDPDVFSPLIGAEIDGFLKTTLRQTLSYNSHLTQNPNEACVYLVLIGEGFPSDKSPSSTTDKLSLNETAIKSLPYWGGDGRNHVLLNLARRDLSVGSGDAFLGASTGRAMIAQSTFTLQQYRPGFDLVTPPALGPPGGDVWSDCAPMAPARRLYILSFQGSQTPAPAGSNIDDDKLLIESLRKMASQAPASDVFMLQFDCDPPIDRRAILPIGDWGLCGTDRSRRAVVQDSTFVLILAPADKSYASTALLQARLYEALRSGAIPVILGGDRIQLPYDEVLDWRRAALSLPKARVTELHFLLRALSDADLLAFRRQGRLLWERYLSSVQASMDSLLATIRTRLNIPPHPAAPTLGVPAFNESFYPPKLEPPAVDTEPEETLGPLEAPYPSPAYRRNYSVSLLHGYELWNDWGEPFALFPQLPWDPPVTSEARFMGSAAGFRPIGAGAGGSGKEFSEALGGDHAREQFTIVILTYEREAVLAAALARLRGLPYLNKVVVVWNGMSPPVASQAWPESGAPVAVVRAPRNSLNNRFLPYNVIETEAVLCVDDDAHLRHDEIVFAFRVWREHRDRIVGFPGRYHAWDLNFNNGFLYNSNYSCELSMVLTGAAFVHRYYLWAYWRALPAAVRDYVDQYMNCEDIAMNFLVAHITRKPPVKVTSRWTFRCPGCPVTLSSDETHFHERHRCIQYFSRVMGYTPLLSTQYRADSVLFKTRISHDKQKCFKFI